MEIESVIKNHLEALLKFLGADPRVSVTKDEQDIYYVDLEGEHLNYLIGFRGESLEALQSLLNLMLYKELRSTARAVVDINSYRKGHKEKMEDIARSYMDQVRFSKQQAEMPVMSASERRYVHVFVADYDDIIAESVGEEPARRIVLKLKV